MANPTYDETNASQAAGISGFGGHLLTEMQDGNMAMRADGQSGAEVVSKLVSLGIEDAEQLVAIASIPEVQNELSTILGGSSDALQLLLSRAKEVLPPDRAVLVSTPGGPDFGLGALLPTPEMIAAAEKSATVAALEAPVTLPTSVNLILFMSAIRNQGSRGTCVSFALTALNEYIRRRSGMTVDLSEEHLYYEIKLIDGAPSACGTWQVKAVMALQSRGECREQVWPYNPNPPCNNSGPLPLQARPDGLHYRLTTFAVPARNVLAYKTNMSSQRPVTVSIPVYNSWYLSAETRRSGRITMRVGNEPVVGGHALCLVGYQDTPASPGGGYFIVRNHWGTGWAYASPYGAGYGTIPYQYIANDTSEAYSATVPGIGGEGETTDSEKTIQANGSKVTIELGNNIKITVSSS